MVFNSRIILIFILRWPVFLTPLKFTCEPVDTKPGSLIQALPTTAFSLLSSLISLITKYTKSPFVKLVKNSTFSNQYFSVVTERAVLLLSKQS